ncbi:hypothetical protein Tco_0596395 [Tanacetum coccineum]
MTTLEESMTVKSCLNSNLVASHQESLSLKPPVRDIPYIACDVSTLHSSCNPELIQALVVPTPDIRIILPPSSYEIDKARSTEPRRPYRRYSRSLLKKKSD